MLTRRHIRVKVMQCIYALSQTREESLDGQKKFLKGSIENMYVLYLLQLSLFTELHKLAEKHVLHDEKKYLSDEKTNWRNPRKFIDNLLWYKTHTFRSFLTLDFFFNMSNLNCRINFRMTVLRSCCHC